MIFYIVLRKHTPSYNTPLRAWEIFIVDKWLREEAPAFSTYATFSVNICIMTQLQFCKDFSFLLRLLLNTYKYLRLLTEGLNK